MGQSETKQRGGCAGRALRLGCGGILLITVCGVLLPAAGVGRNDKATATSLAIAASDRSDPTQVPTRGAGPALATNTPAPAAGFNAAEYAAAVQAELTVPGVVSIDLRDGRPAGTTREIWVTYNYQRATDPADMLVETVDIFRFVGNAIGDAALDVDAVIVVAGINDRAVAMFTATASDSVGLATGSILQSVFLSRMTSSALGE